RRASAAGPPSPRCPSTPRRGASPASRARRAARRTSASPSGSSNILLRPMRRGAPAASATPATRGAGAPSSLRSGMDRRLALAQRVGPPTRAHRQDLRDDGQRDLLRPVGPDVEAHGAVDPRRVALAERGGRTQDLEHPLRALARSQDRKSTRLNSSHGSISYAV